MFLEFIDNANKPVLVNVAAIAAVAPVNDARTYIYLMARRPGENAGGFVLVVEEPYDQVRSRISFATR